jgi:nicotinamidase-related amidase
MLTTEDRDEVRSHFTNRQVTYKGCQIREQADGSYWLYPPVGSARKYDDIDKLIRSVDQAMSRTRKLDIPVIHMDHHHRPRLARITSVSAEGKVIVTMDLKGLSGRGEMKKLSKYDFKYLYERSPANHAARERIKVLKEEIAEREGEVRKTVREMKNLSASVVFPDEEPTNGTE